MVLDHLVDHLDPHLVLLGRSELFDDEVKAHKRVGHAAVLVFADRHQLSEPSFRPHHHLLLRRIVHVACEAVLAYTTKVLVVLPVPVHVPDIELHLEPPETVTLGPVTAPRHIRDRPISGAGEHPGLREHGGRPKRATVEVVPMLRQAPVLETEHVIIELDMLHNFFRRLGVRLCREDGEGSHQSAPPLPPLNCTRQGVVAVVVPFVPGSVPCSVSRPVPSHTRCGDGMPFPAPPL